MEKLSRVWEWNAFVVREVETIIFTFPPRHYSGDLGDNISWPLVGALHVTRTRSTIFASYGASDSHGRSLQGVLTGVQLV